MILGLTRLCSCSVLCLTGNSTGAPSFLPWSFLFHVDSCSKACLCVPCLEMSGLDFLIAWQLAFKKELSKGRVSACFDFANVSLAKASHMSKHKSVWEVNLQLHKSWGVGFLEVNNVNQSWGADSSSLECKILTVFLRFNAYMRCYIGATLSCLVVWECLFIYQLALVVG